MFLLGLLASHTRLKLRISPIPCSACIGSGFLIFSFVLLKRWQVEKRGAKYHRERLGEALREEIETIVEGELADPRIGLVSVTSVVLAEDSRSAQVFVTLDGNDEEAERSLAGLTAAVGFIRREVAENLHLRRPPELYFHLDRSDQYGARIDELLGRTRRKKR
jgi:ribosome-binding factor A